jgi:UDP-N-acetylglucosamine 1-carboxyvinyltransferase
MPRQPLDRFRGARIHLDLPSVGATEHLMMVAALAEGETIIENAACEPEITDLGAALSAMGAQVSGAGEPIIRISGASRLHGMDFSVVPDRIEAGTFLMAAAITGGDVFVRGARAEHLQAVVSKLREAGVAVDEDAEGLRARVAQRLRGVDVKTAAYPLPDRSQAQMMVRRPSPTAPASSPRRSSRTASCTRRSSCASAPTSPSRGPTRWCAASPA